jgi:6-phosphogluconate dehydrogenase
VLVPPRAVWLMLPAGAVTAALDDLAPRLDPGDIVLDGGNSHYRDALARSRQLAPLGLHFVDVGVSGGIWGLERGYCLMIGGAAEVVARLEPLFAALAPGGPPDLTPARRGFLHCGSSGAGHFVKMVHNGIEYGLMAAYAEGFNILRHADVGERPRTTDAESAPLRHPESYLYEFDLPQIAELWQHGSVISGWLLELAARALAHDDQLSGFSGRVADSGEGRWALEAALDESVPAPVLASALQERFRSRGEGDFADKLIAALRLQFGGHHERDG